MTNTKITRTVVPAQPGFDVVLLGREPYELVYSPIVAWVVEELGDYGMGQGFAYAHPVCADWNYNSAESDNDGILRQPNGDIVFIGGKSFCKGEETEALAHAIKQYEMQVGVREVMS